MARNFGFMLLAIVLACVVAFTFVRKRQATPTIQAPLRAEILTWTNLDRVVRQLKLDADLKTAADWQNEYETLRKAITIRAATQRRGVDLIEIAVSDKKPVMAQQIANAIADNYVEENPKAPHDETIQAIILMSTEEEKAIEVVKRTEAELSQIKAQIQNNTGDLQALGEKEKNLQKTHDEAKEASEQYHKTILALQDKLKTQARPSGVQVEIIARALVPAQPYNHWSGMYLASAILKRKDLGVVGSVEGTTTQVK